MRTTTAEIAEFLVTAAARGANLIQFAQTRFPGARATEIRAAVTLAGKRRDLDDFEHEALSWAWQVGHAETLRHARAH